MTHAKRIYRTNMTAIAEQNHFNKIEITGSKTQKEFEMLLKQYEAIGKTSDSAYEKFFKIHSAKYGSSYS